MTADTTERPTNVKGLVLPEIQGSELPFDPDRDISPEQVGRCINYLTESKHSAPLRRFHRNVASDMVILFPEKRGEFDLLPAKDLVKETSMDHRGHTNYDMFRLIYPDEITRTVIDNAISFKDYSDIVRANIYNIEHWRLNGSKMLWEAFILFPDEFEKIKSMSRLVETLSLAADYNRGRIWQEFAMFNVILKFSGHNPEITEGDWDEMKRELNQETDIRKFTALAARMKLLAASEIKMTEQGLQVVMPEPAAKRGITPQVPVTKKY